MVLESGYSYSAECNQPVGLLYILKAYTHDQCMPILKMTVGLTLQKLSLNLHHKPGVKIYISDTLSRASLPFEQDNDQIPDHLICQLGGEKAITDDIENTVNY